MADLDALLADLDTEGEALDALVALLPPDAFARATPAPGWSIAHQLAHLTWTDAVAVLAATDPAAFAMEVERAVADPHGFVDRAAAEWAGLPPATLLAGWRDGRARLHEVLRALPPGMKVPWFGPPMKPASMVTARLMETWAHGQDVADALGERRVPTARLRHVAHLGVRTRDFAFAQHGLPVPAEQFRIELMAPDGEIWCWGPPDATESVTGPALDFCLLVTRRRHRADTAIAAVGPNADAWLDIAQAFAGPPGEGRPPGAFA